MILKTQPFKDFFAYIKAMRPNNLLPVYEYMLLNIQNGVGTLEKTNGIGYCKHTFEADGNCKVLIEDLEIKTFLSVCKEQEFEMFIDGNKVLLQSGKIKSSFTTLDADSFPDAPEFSGEPQEVDTKYFSIANKYTEPKGMSWLQCVVANSDGIIGTDNTKVYYYNYPVNQEIVLGYEACNIISDMGIVKHSHTDNHDFFYNDDVMYGFNKNPFHNIQYMHVVKNISDSGWIIDKSDILSFCEMVQSRFDKYCTMQGYGNKIILSFNDKDISKSSEIEIEIDGDFTGSFHFLPQTMASCLKNIPYAKLKMDASYHLSITSPEDENYKGLITKIMI